MSNSSKLTKKSIIIGVLLLLSLVVVAAGSMIWLKMKSDEESTILVVEEESIGDAEEVIEIMSTDALSSYTVSDLFTDVVNKFSYNFGFSKYSNDVVRAIELAEEKGYYLEYNELETIPYIQFWDEYGDSIKLQYIGRALSSFTYNRGEASLEVVHENLRDVDYLLTKVEKNIRKVFTSEYGDSLELYKIPDYYLGDTEIPFLLVLIPNKIPYRELSFSLQKTFGIESLSLSDTIESQNEEIDFYGYKGKVMYSFNDSDNLQSMVWEFTEDKLVDKKSVHKLVDQISNDLGKNTIREDETSTGCTYRWQIDSGEEYILFVTYSTNSTSIYLRAYPNKW